VEVGANERSDKGVGLALLGLRPKNIGKYTGKRTIYVTVSHKTPSHYNTIYKYIYLLVFLSYKSSR
jgi:hypothetical protein